VFALSALKEGYDDLLRHRSGESVSPATHSPHSPLVRRNHPEASSLTVAASPVHHRVPHASLSSLPLPRPLLQTALRTSVGIRW
jgi:hypothetical protein